MPSMKKKNNYESPGLVRRLLKKGSSFRSIGGESINDSVTTSPFKRLSKSERKWRPRKNQFELLDGDDDSLLSTSFQYDNPSSWNIQNAISGAESEPGEYRRDIMFDQKATALKKTPVKIRSTDRKKELTPIKPPCKDTSSILAPTSSAKKSSRNEWGDINRQDSLNFSTSITSAESDDPFFTPTTDSFGFEIHEKKNDGTKLSTISDHLEKSSKPSQRHPNSSLSSVVSDPTDFFSKEQSTKLTMSNLAKMDSKKVVKESKFYQFAIDEDKASTVVESSIQLPADYPGGDYAVDDATEMSCDETSQGTRIQPGSVASERRKKLAEAEKAQQDILASSSHSRKHAIEVKEFDEFFPSNFPSSTDKDGFFPDFGGAKETQQNIPPPPPTDISSSVGGDDYFNPRHGQESTKSLAYSISPANTKKSVGRQPLSLRNSQPSSGKKNRSFQAASPFSIREREAQFQFDVASPSARPSLSSKKKRHSSIGSRSNMQPPPADPFDSSPHKFTPGKYNSAKENNFTVKSNRYEDFDDDWGMDQNKQRQPNIYQPPTRPFKDDTDSDEDVDDFDDVGNWERPAHTCSSIGRGVIASHNRTNAVLNRAARLSRRSNESYNRPSRNQYIDDYDDDAQSASGFSVSKTPSTKPLALPSNAIMASMLFQTQQYEVDQNDVQQKIKAIEEENTRHRRIRHSQGGIPDSVNTDDDYMTTVSSFSDATSAYMQQESWRKPSRDLLNHFTSARALDMEYRRLPVRKAPVVEQRPQHLYEA